jgi:hypothetical protein
MLAYFVEGGSRFFILGSIFLVVALSGCSSTRDQMCATVSIKLWRIRHTAQLVA